MSLKFPHHFFQNSTFASLSVQYILLIFNNFGLKLLKKGTGFGYIRLFDHKIFFVHFCLNITFILRAVLQEQSVWLVLMELISTVKDLELIQLGDIKI